AARYVGRRVPGTKRLLRRSHVPFSANHCSLRATATGSKNRCAHERCNNGRPTARASRYNSASPTQIPKDTPRKLVVQERLPAAASRAPLTVGTSSCTKVSRPSVSACAAGIHSWKPSGSQGSEGEVITRFVSRCAPPLKGRRRNAPAALHPSAPPLRR